MNGLASLTHADNGAAVVQGDTLALQAVSALAHHLGDALVKGVAEGDVGDNAALEESPWAHALGTVNDLVGDHEVAGLDLLLQTADGGEGDDGANTDGAEGSDVGTGRNLVGSDLVVGTVTAQESDCDSLAVVLALVVQDGDGGGRSAPGGLDVQRSNLAEAGQLTQTSASDDSNWDGPCQIVRLAVFEVGVVRGIGLGNGVPS